MHNRAVHEMHATHLIQRQMVSQVGVVHVKGSLRQVLAEPRLAQHIRDGHAVLGIGHQQAPQQVLALAGDWDVLRDDILCRHNLPDIVLLVGIKRVPPIQQGVQEHTARPQICFLHGSHNRVSDL